MPQNSSKSAEPCPWCTGFDLYRQYHDEEWGLPLRNDLALFELLNLEGAQAGLSWSTVLKKREHYRLVFDGFKPELIADYDEAKIAALLADPGIIRNRAKVAATILNAKAYLAIKASGQSFSDYLWQFVGNTPIQNKWSSMAQVPSSTPESIAMSKALLKAGFKFVGPTICYAFMQASGMVNDHLVSCPRHQAVQAK
ncbi:DNA-3-methyladenine glycosylase I [Fluviibacter phosphoraccumulans]|jgi:DNA-3-methyladenine glycosylase I|uniref:DNA-3-methyladenine glycosylase I n=1 Tax=Fluviibacter phosphoraccumulans TaxID=1751046 RepID=A0A679I589_9RHOO|nr:DNA-3-methyladenine glycosylase I [Fluviibacter phosphoraccumulans]BBU69564.1 DNA-3-methyladenine glycosylase I [Fluviibacter phosphoraccumulans]BBU71253.1 DNA-3-methyladenine glycosylase I [Fluviibacter phosphoraccumulans]BCA65503.1 DNA-3-methyladenine glycosylase I [Fluviibacter phosphoraccumulans]